jgi:hypothetical protein
MSIILLVLFVMTMFLWLLSLVGAVSMPSNWLAFFACLFLGAAIFLGGGPVVVMR